MTDINCKEKLHTLTQLEYSRIASPGLKQYHLDKYCKRKDLDKIKSITGPFLYGEYVFAGRNIHLFGEIHSLSQPCGNFLTPTDITLPGFLHSLFTENNKINYDLLVEYPLFFDEMKIYNKRTKKIITKSRNNIVSLSATPDSLMFALFYIMFNKYFGKEKDITDYPNVRFHYVDPRDLLVFENLEIMSDRYTELILDVDINTFITRMTHDCIYVKKLLDNLPFLKHNDNIDADIIERINLFINEEYDKIFAKCNDFIVKLQETLDKNGMEFMKYPKKLKDDFINNLLLCSHQVFKIVALTMDKYTLYRMFRNFGKKTLNVKSQQIYSGPTQNVIFYGGSAHAQLYHNFLKANGAKVLKTINTEIPEELFSDYLSPQDTSIKNNCIELDVSTSLFMNPILPIDNTQNNKNQTGGTKKKKVNKKNYKNTKKSKNNILDNLSFYNL